MALPQAIQAQVDQAEATIAALNTAPEASPLLAAHPLTAADPVDTQPEQTAETPPQATSPQPAPQPQVDPWQHKYRTLQGRYNSDVPQLQTRVKELEAQLQNAIAKMNEVSAPAAAKKPAADPQDVEAFGSDLVGMVQRVAERMFGDAAREFKEHAARFDQRLAQLEQGLQGTTSTVAATAEQAFFDRLTMLVPEWEAVNVNDSFLGWLAEVDPIYGQPRQAALNAAQQTFNADRAANVFRAFLEASQTASKPSSVSKQVSPKAAASAAPATTNAAKPVFTQAQVKAFYDEMARGLWKGRQQEAAQIEARINAAMAEGRIR